MGRHRHVAKHFSAKLDKALGCWRPHKLCVSMMAVGVFLTLASLPVPFWRVDRVGWGPIMGSEKAGEPPTQSWGDTAPRQWYRRNYGLFYAEGSTRLSWAALFRTTCDMRDLATITSVGTQIVSVFKDGKQACSNDSCGVGYMTHLTQRCQAYQKIYSACLALTVMTCFGVIIPMTALVFGLHFKRGRGAGIIGTGSCFGGFLILVANVMWAVTTDSGFTQIMESAWYPYAELSYGYYCHLFGGLFLVTGGGIYLYACWDEIQMYDVVGTKFHKGLKRLEDRKFKLLQMKNNLFYGNQGATNYGNAQPGMTVGGGVVTTTQHNVMPTGVCYVQQTHQPVSAPQYVQPKQVVYQQPQIQVQVPVESYGRPQPPIEYSMPDAPPTR